MEQWSSNASLNITLHLLFVLESAGTAQEYIPGQSVTLKESIFVHTSGTAVAFLV